MLKYLFSDYGYLSNLTIFKEVSSSREQIESAM